jgi:transcription antitermination factor NusG
MRIGQRVRIDSGALDGLEGVLVRVGDGRRLVLSVSLLQRSVAVEIDARCVSPITGSAAMASVVAAVNR